MTVNDQHITELHGKSLRFILYSYSELLVCYSRNLYGIEWAQQNPRGLKSNFDTYRKVLSEDQKQVGAYV